METEAAALPTRGNHEESSGGDRRGAAAGCARSFDCAFCKRGFSNAQALGGHMNMHRKDRAKLKSPPSRCCRFPFDVSGSSVAAASATYAPVVVVVERSTPPRQPAGYSGGRASWCSAPAAPLALFAERTAWGGDGDDDGGGGGGGGGRRGIDEERRGHEAELDLELRLGRSETYLRSSKDRN